MATTYIQAGNATNQGVNIQSGNDGTIHIQSGTTPVTAMTVDASQNVSTQNAINVPNTFGFKNRIINGAMVIWQRGTSGFTTGYNADRWAQINGTISAISQSTDVPSGYKYSLSMIGSGSPGVGQRIESFNCTDLVGQSITISFWAKQSSGAASGSIGLNLYYANSSDNFSGITQIGSGQSFTGTTGWVQYTATFTSLPSGAANGLGVYLYSNVSGSSTTLFTGVQLEVGTQATSFDCRDYGRELIMCQRYYQNIPSDFYLVSTNVLGSQMRSTQYTLPVVMRTSPSIGFGGGAEYITPGGGGTSISPSTGGATIYNFWLYYGSGLANGGLYHVYGAQLSAEL